MPSANNWNANVIDEFRANRGVVRDFFNGAPLVLLHHRGRTTGNEYVTPVMYLASETEPGVLYIFATKSGAPANPAWYGNVMQAQGAEIEVGEDRFSVSVSEVSGAERDRVYAEQVRRYPHFGEYEERTAGVRTIPVLALRRV